MIYIGQASGIRAEKWSDATLFDRIDAYPKFRKERNVYRSVRDGSGSCFLVKGVEEGYRQN